MQEDDEDEDFVGVACETHSACYTRKDPRPYSFYEVSVNGYCCISLYQGGPGTDPCSTDDECPQGYLCDPAEAFKYASKIEEAEPGYLRANARMFFSLQEVQKQVLVRPPPEETWQLQH